MPIVAVGDGEFILRCINNHADVVESEPARLQRRAAGTDKVADGKVTTTMHGVPGWGFVGGNPTQSRLHLTAPQSLPVRAFHCSVCGYVEMYANAVTAAAGANAGADDGTR
jgi:hypothetical protein